MRVPSNTLFITTYSAHSSILNKMEEEFGKIEKLYVDAGGLRLPFSAKDCDLFKRYTPSLTKTLHAKVALNKGDKLNEVWLWTGNLRYSTFDCENILMSFPVSGAALECVSHWFDSVPENHIVFTSDGDSVTSAEILNYKSDCTTIWDSVDRSVKKCNINKDVDHVLAISPWGSKCFVENLLGLFENAKIDLCTRYAGDDDSLWLDCFSSDDRISRWISYKDNFPHYKCIFALKDRQIVWCYIGSANFTETAFFDVKNVEYALFFENPKSCSKLTGLFQSVSNKKNWLLRKVKKEIDSLYTEKKKELSNEFGSGESFEERELTRILQKKYNTESKQKELDYAYEHNKSLDISFQKRNVKIKVSYIGISIYKIRAGIYEIILRRYGEKKSPLNDVDEKMLFDSFKLEETYIIKKKKKIQKGSSKPSEQSRNLRFPIRQALLPKNKVYVEGLYKKMLDLDFKSLKNDENKKMYQIWFPLLERIAKGLV